MGEIIYLNKEKLILTKDEEIKYKHILKKIQESNGLLEIIIYEHSPT